MSVKKKTGLGRGLDALIAPSKNNQSENSESEEVNEKKKKNSKTDKNTTRKTIASDIISDQDESNASEKEIEENDKNIKIVEVPVEKIVEVPVEKIVKIPAENGTITVKIDEIEPNNDQPRKNFDEGTLQELADSIRQHGIIQPLVVVKEDNYYKIIAGERRWRAARLAGLNEIPVIVKDYSPQEAIEIALIENIQRDDLDPIEEADAFRRLIDEYGLKQEEAAERVSKSRTAITNSLRLLKLDDRIKQMISENMITAGHGRALLSIEDPQRQYELAMKIFDEKLSVRETERIIRNLLKPKTPKKEIDSQIMQAYHTIEEKVTSALGSKVSINPRTKKKGKIEIEYYSEEDLDRIVNLLTSVK